MDDKSAIEIVREQQDELMRRRDGGLAGLMSVSELRRLHAAVEREAQETRQLEIMLTTIREKHCSAEARAERLADDARRYRWLKNRMTYCATDRTPTLASVSNRLWYHATDDVSHSSLDDMIDAALRRVKSIPHVAGIRHPAGGEYE